MSENKAGYWFPEYFTPASIFRISPASIPGSGKTELFLCFVFLAYFGYERIARCRNAPVSSCI